MSLLFACCALGPAMLGYALAYLLKNSQDWTGPAVIIPLSAVLTVVVYTWGVRWLRPRLKASLTTQLAAAQVGGLVMGVVVFCLAYFVLLD